MPLATRFHSTGIADQDDFIAPIPGARKLNHLEQNVAAAEIVRSAAELTALGDALSPNRVAGKRYSDGSLALTNR